MAEDEGTAETAAGVPPGWCAVRTSSHGTLHFPAERVLLVREPPTRNGRACLIVFVDGGTYEAPCPAGDVVRLVADALAAGRGEVVPASRRRAA